MDANKRRRRPGLLAALLAAWAAPLAAAPEAAYYTPTPGNQFVSRTEKYLYVVWALPRDLAPLKGHTGKEDLEAFLGRTAVYLCAQHAAPGEAKDCKFHVLRMTSNDEYTKSPAGSFDTVGKMLLPVQEASKEGLLRALKAKPADVPRLFTRFQVNEDLVKALAGP